MNADIEVIFHFNDNRTLYEGFRPSHLIDGVNLTTGVHHYYDTSNTEVKGTIEFIAPEYYPNCLKSAAAHSRDFSRELAAAPFI